jgi:crotonobetainyl-CoA:carnitine CoA-transferase CaiB-like acyl-CoA transferase
VTSTALDGLRVVEIGHGIAGPYAGRLLADLGAEVIKIERPNGGDPMRSRAPFAAGPDGAQRSVLFEYLNWGKRSVRADLRTASGRERVSELVASADIVLVALRPAAVRRLGIEPNTLCEWNSRAAITLVSAFGHSGPYRDWEASDLVLQAMGGVMQISGTVEEGPLKPGLDQSLYCAGINAAYISLAASRAAQRSGVGVITDLSIQETIASQLVMNEPYYAFLGVVQGRRSQTQDPLSGEAVPAGDGFVSLQSTTLTPVSRFSELFGDERFASPDYATEDARTRHADQFAALLAGHLEHVQPRDVFVAASERGLLAGFVQPPAQLLDCPQLAAREAWRTDRLLSLRGRAVVLPVGVPQMSATPVDTSRPAPELGADDAIDVAPRTVSTAGTEAPCDGPLTGLRVIDLSTVFAVPYVGALLADLGADVIKVEAPARLDQTRSSFGAAVGNDPSGAYWNKASTFQVLNRGKRSVVLDLRTDAGQRALRALIADADVLLENFTPRVMPSWGLTYAELAEINPGLIMLSNTGYGSTGPWAPFKAQGTTLEATMGLTSVTGYGPGRPMKAGQSYPDFIACWHGLLSVLAALQYRDRTGTGQWIDLGMYPLGATVIPEAVIEWQAHARALGPAGNVDQDAFVSGLFPTKEPDRWVAVSVYALDQLVGLADAVPEVAEIAAVGDPGAAETAAVLGAVIGAWLRELTADEATTTLQNAGIAAGPVLDARDLLENEHLRSRGFYEWVDFSDWGHLPLIGRPFRWTSEGSNIPVPTRAPRFGEHNREVLCESAGLSAAEYEKLLASGVTATAPVDPPPGAPQPLADMARRGTITVDADYLAHLDSLRPRG